MSLNLKKLQSIARRRLKLTGSVQFETIPRAQASSDRVGSEFLSTTTNMLTTTHTILYVNAGSLNAPDVYHELCKAKLNECGFTTIEAAALHAMKDCSKEDPKYIRDANSSITIITEAYANFLLFSKFDEAKDRRESIILRFESDNALTTLHTQMGFWGTAGISYYKIASQWAEIAFPQKQIEDAIQRAWDGKEIMKEYYEINSLLNNLPKLDLFQPERISDVESIQIVDIMVQLFSKKTGLEC